MDYRSLICYVFLSFLMVSCAKEPTKVSVTGISINPNSLSLKEDQSSNIVATIIPDNADNKQILWSSSDGAVASVNNGTVSALKPGTAIITATSQEGGFTATCEVFVASKSWYNLIDDEIILIEGDKEKLIVLEVRNGMAQGVIDNESLVWSSSNSAVATVDKGYIKAIKEGSVTITVKTDYINGHCTVTVKKKTIPEPVDLGLSVKWAPFNIGATKEEERGYLFAWGETEPKNYYAKWTYKWIKDDFYTKYNSDSFWGTVDNKTVLDSEDDAAYVNWGGEWRTPTRENCLELINNCDFTWSTVNEIKGYKITSRINGNYIFLPDIGDAITGNSSYWSSSHAGYDSAHDISFNNHGFILSSRERSYGNTIRPVFIQK